MQKFSFVSLFLLFLCILQHIHGVILEVKTGMKRCIYDILERDSLAIGEFQVIGQVATGISLNVEGPRYREIYSVQNKLDGKFAFTAQVKGKHSVCIENVHLETHMVSVKLRSGVEAKDLNAIVQKEHLDPLAAEILRLEETLVDIRKQLLRRKYVDTEMRETNDTIRFRVGLFSFISIVITATLGLGQVLYMRSYFRKKHLI